MRGEATTGSTVVVSVVLPGAVVVLSLTTVVEVVDAGDGGGGVDMSDRESVCRKREIDTCVWMDTPTFIG